MLSIEATKINPIDNFFRDTEKTFNKIGYFPVAGTFVAVSRILLATAQLVCAVGLAILAGIASIVTAFTKGDQAKKGMQNACREMGIISLNYLLQAITNYMRAGFEAVPFLPLSTTYIYDSKEWRILKYPSEPRSEIALNAVNT